MLSQGYNPGNGTDSPTLLREPLLSESDGMVDKTLYVDPARKQKKKKKQALKLVEGGDHFQQWTRHLGFHSESSTRKKKKKNNNNNKHRKRSSWRNNKVGLSPERA